MAVGNQTPVDVATEYASLQFVVMQLLSRVQTLTLVRIVSCTNAGGIVPAGTVVVQPLVNMLAGDRTAIKHKPIYELPYVRAQGGTSAVIIDPKPGDIGLAGFCSRDISAVKASKGQANPGSLRQFDMADGIYIGGCLNAAPVQYVVLNDEGVKILSPTQITLEAPTINLKGAVEATSTIHTPSTITGDTDVMAAGKSGAHHTHGGVQSGGSQTGQPT